MENNATLLMATKNYDKDKDQIKSIEANNVIHFLKMVFAFLVRDAYSSMIQEDLGWIFLEI